jgi:hypothetical protein
VCLASALATEGLQFEAVSGHFSATAQTPEGLMQILLKRRITRPEQVRRRIVTILAALMCLCLAHPAYAGSRSCGPEWHSARLTNYESYPEPGSAECIENNGCTWAGQFYGGSGTYSEVWVAKHNIVAVHLKDWAWLGMKTLRLRQGTREIIVRAIDACSDADCDGCCTANLGGDGHLIDIEKYTMARFGSGDGLVEFQVCD